MGNFWIVPLLHSVSNTLRFISKHNYKLKYTVNEMSRKCGIQDRNDKCIQYKITQKPVTHILVYILQTDFCTTLYFTVENSKRHHIGSFSLASIIIYLKWILKK
jgi:hypothetical protein